MTEFGACTEFVLGMEEELAFFEGVVLTGYSLTKKAHTWLLIVRVKDRGKAMVGFFEAEEQVDCFRLLWVKIHKRTALKWQVDKFARK